MSEGVEGRPGDRAEVRQESGEVWRESGEVRPQRGEAPPERGAVHGALVWRALRRMLPREWRERNGEDMLRTHVDLGGGDTRARGPGFWLTVARDVMLTAVQVRLDTLRGRRRSERVVPGHRGGRDVSGAGHRSERAGPFDVFGHTLRLALRGLRRAPAFAASVVAIFALGIAANVTMFRVLDRVLLSAPPHIAQPDEVRRVHVFGRSPFSGNVVHSPSLTYPDYRQLRQVDAIPAVAGYSGRELTLFDESGTERVRTEWVTASYFPLLGVAPALGRFFGEDEDRLGGDPVAVLGYAYWQRRFGGAREVIGSDLTIGKARYTVVGVTPAGFTGISIEPVDVWLPLHPAAEAESGTMWVDAHGWYMMGAIARVPALRKEAAEEAATLAHRAGREGQRSFDSDALVVLSPLIAARGPNASRESQVARLLGMLTVLVLLVTCANVGNLFLARVLSRGRELAVQAALGVSRARLSGQLLAEVGVLALLAAGLALWISAVAGSALFRLLLPDVAPPEPLDSRVIAATIGIAFVTAVVTGVVPALRATRADVMDTLRKGRTSTGARGARRVLLMAQSSMSVVLLVGAGLFIRSLQRAESIDLGLDRATLAVEIELEGGENFGEALSSAVHQALPRVREHGAVSRAATTSILPFSGWWGVPLDIPQGDSLVSGQNGPFVFAVSGDYFETTGLQIVHGRSIRDADDLPGAPRVAVVNERLAAAAWPGRSAIGQCIVPRPSEHTECTTVIGVARDIVHNLTSDEVLMIFYLTTGHPALNAASNGLVIRAAEGIDNEVIRRAVLESVAGARFASVASIEERLAPQLRSWRLGASLLTAFGLFALVIAAAGLYSTLAFDVTQRRRELGVRAALGAPARRLVRSVLAGNLAVVGAGIGIGLVVSIIGGRAAEAMLFRVSADDPFVFAGVAITLLLAGAVAAAVPAWSATRVDPAMTLRDD